jgi:hypothetical protein
LTKWYQLDLNARPRATPAGVWLLKPRTKERDNDYTDFSVWGRDVERPLRQIFVDLGLTDDAHLKYWASATEQEIGRGALNVDDASDHVFCFFRKINGLPQDGTAEGFRDLVPAQGGDAQRARLVSDTEAGQRVAVRGRCGAGVARRSPCA